MRTDSMVPLGSFAPAAEKRSGNQTASFKIDKKTLSRSFMNSLSVLKNLKLHSATSDEPKKISNIFSGSIVLGERTSRKLTVHHITNRMTEFLGKPFHGSGNVEVRIVSFFFVVIRGVDHQGLRLTILDFSGSRCALTPKLRHFIPGLLGFQD